MGRKVKEIFRSKKTRLLKKSYKLVDIGKLGYRLLETDELNADYVMSSYNQNKYCPWCGNRDNYRGNHQVIHPKHFCTIMNSDKYAAIYYSSFCIKSDKKPFIIEEEQHLISPEHCSVCNCKELDKKYMQCNNEAGVVLVWVCKNCKAHNVECDGKFIHTPSIGNLPESIRSDEEALEYIKKNTYSLYIKPFLRGLEDISFNRYINLLPYIMFINYKKHNDFSEAEKIYNIIINDEAKPLTKKTVLACASIEVYNSLVQKYINMIQQYMNKNILPEEFDIFKSFLAAFMPLNLETIRYKFAIYFDEIIQELDLLHDRSAMDFYHLFDH
ncbi:MAG: hypothetical protein WC955_05085 [Elusimicrobiota bacterium]